jgi:CRISPR-associated protein Cmr2
MSTQTTYAAVTFAPVQGFIEKSRKLRDLYGGSFILSYLARTICEQAKTLRWQVVSPALPNVTQGTPNQILLQKTERSCSDETLKTELRKVFDRAWKNLVETVRLEIESDDENQNYATWHRSWELWEKYAWEWFCVVGEANNSLSDVREQMNEAKRSRAWVGVNWQGESSTLSGMDAIAWPGMDVYKPKTDSRRQRAENVDTFYQQLSPRWGGKIIDASEKLSIPELVKRLTTIEDMTAQIPDGVPPVENPDRCADLNRLNTNTWTAWFMGDGDKIGDYLKDLKNSGHDEATSTHELSHGLMKWGENLNQRVQDTLKKKSNYRIIYAGGDDFLGVLYRNGGILSAIDWLPWLYQFDQLWAEYQDYFEGEKPTQLLTVSMGLVWAGPSVPQRDVLQHCREAERSAKKNGRDRVAIRILFNSGTHLEWTCPWHLLQPILDAECNWTNFYRDIGHLEARHAFEVPAKIREQEIGEYTKVAIAILKQHLKPHNPEFDWSVIANPEQWFNREDHTGILGGRDRFADHEAQPDENSPKKYRYDQIATALNDWAIALAHVGFQLFRRGK